MLGAIIGDIVGSRFEWHNYRAKDFEFFSNKCFVTDDSIMSLAVCEAICEAGDDYMHLGEITVKAMQRIGRPYPHCGYGGLFYIGCIAMNLRLMGALVMVLPCALVVVVLRLNS